MSLSLSCPSHYISTCMKSGEKIVIIFWLLSFPNTENWHYFKGASKREALFQKEPFSQPFKGPLCLGDHSQLEDMEIKSGKRGRIRCHWWGIMIQINRSTVLWGEKSASHFRWINTIVLKNQTSLQDYL